MLLSTPSPFEDRVLLCVATFVRKHAAHVGQLRSRQTSLHFYQVLGMTSNPVAMTMSLLSRWSLGKR